jgi:hypothetical protein
MNELIRGSDHREAADATFEVARRVGPTQGPAAKVSDDQEGLGGSCGHAPARGIGKDFLVGFSQSWESPSRNQENRVGIDDPSVVDRRHSSLGFEHKFPGIEIRPPTKGSVIWKLKFESKSAPDPSRLQEFTKAGPEMGLPYCGRSGFSVSLSPCPGGRGGRRVREQPESLASWSSRAEASDLLFACRLVRFPPHADRHRRVADPSPPGLASSDKRPESSRGVGMSPPAIAGRKDKGR